MRIFGLFVAIALTLGPAPAHAQDGPAGPAATLSRAAKAIEALEYQRAADLLFPLTASFADILDRQDRAEAWRLFGLAQFFLKQYEGAERSFLEYLKLDVDGRLDPGLVPPEAVSFFEEVRSRNAALLRKYRPKPRKRRSWALNLVPPAGQFQNRHRRKGWAIGTTGAVLIATNLTTYFVLRSWCDPETNVCTSESADTVRAANLASGALFLAVLGYGIIDGFANYKRSANSRISVGVVPLHRGGGVGIYSRF